MKRRYFDNAATSFPKPPGVAEAIQHQLLNVGASAGRGAYREAVDAGKLLDRLRTRIRRLFHAQPADSVVFTLNGTDALNLAIKGIVRDHGHVVTTSMDHNSVLRPLSAMQQTRGIAWTPVPADPSTTHVDPRAIVAALQPETQLVVVNHASNVTGAIQPIAEIAAACARRGVPLLVDAAQTAGHVPIDIGELGPCMLAMPGHKGLLGPTGTGVLVIHESIAPRLRSVREGGTGSSSELPVQPPHLPDLLEAGSHNAIGLAGLDASLAWLEERGIDAIAKHEHLLVQQMLPALAGMAGLTLFGPGAAATDNHFARVGVFSVRVDGMEPAEVSAILETSFGILSRSGLHCAPLAHQTIGTHNQGGTTRLSLGPFLGADDVDAAIHALRDIARAAG